MMYALRGSSVRGASRPAVSGCALRERFAARIGHFVDQIRIDPEAAVCEHRIRARRLQRRDEARTERHRQIRRGLVGVETETLRDEVLRVLGADERQNADRHEVLRLLQRETHRHRTVRLVVVLRLPRVAARRARREIQRRVVDDRGRSETLVERGRIDERLEARTRLTPRLRDVVELVLVEVEAADQRANRAVLRRERHQRAFHLRQLRDLPVALVVRRPDARSSPA